MASLPTTLTERFITIFPNVYHLCKTAMAKEYNYMIEKDIRQGGREKNLLNALLKLNRVKLDEGGPVKPLTLADYLKVGIQNSSLSEDERKEMQALLDKMLGVKKK